MHERPRHHGDPTRAVERRSSTPPTVRTPPRPTMGRDRPPAQAPRIGRPPPSATVSPFDPSRVCSDRLTLSPCFAGDVNRMSCVHPRTPSARLMPPPRRHPSPSPWRVLANCRYGLQVLVQQRHHGDTWGPVQFCHGAHPPVRTPSTQHVPWPPTRTCTSYRSPATLSNRVALRSFSCALID